LCASAGVVETPGTINRAVRIAAGSEMKDATNMWPSAPGTTGSSTLA